MEPPESSLDLPSFTPATCTKSIFTCAWGFYGSDAFTSSFNDSYVEIVHWRPNLFKVPFGKAGKSFVFELARLYRVFASSSSLESIATKVAVVLPTLLLQKPSSKSKKHNTYLERRLNSWLDGNLNDLSEGRTIQRRIPKSNQGDGQKSLTRSFVNLMIDGKT